MRDEIYTVPADRFKDDELFSLKLYKKENCNDLLEFFENVLSNEQFYVVPPSKNPIFDTDLILPISNKFMNIIEKYDVFSALMSNGYFFRENPRIVTWSYTGRDKRGAAHHYHHDGWDKGGQVSVMFMLQSNKEGTHMRLLENTRDGIFHQTYSKVIRFRHYNKYVPKILRKIVTTLILTLMDAIIDMKNFKKLAGDKGTLFVFNTDQMHKAHAVKNTTRSIVHINFVKDEDNKNDLVFDNEFVASSLGLVSKGLCATN